MAEKKIVRNPETGNPAYETVNYVDIEMDQLSSQISELEAQYGAKEKDVEVAEEAAEAGRRELADLEGRLDDLKRDQEAINALEPQPEAVAGPEAASSEGQDEATEGTVSVPVQVESEEITMLEDDEEDADPGY